MREEHLECDMQYQETQDWLNSAGYSSCEEQSEQWWEHQDSKVQLQQEESKFWYNLSVSLNKIRRSK